MNMRALALIVVAVLTASPIAAATTLPAAPPPSGFLASDGATGGRILYGTVRAAKTDAALKAGLHAANAYFGGTLGVDAVVQNAQGSVPAMIAWFRAALHGVPVTGLAVAAVDPRGGARVAVLFDRPDRIARSLPALSSTLSARAATTGGARGGVLRTVNADDRSMSIGLPPGWTVRGMQHGTFSVAGPDGALVETYSVVVASPMNNDFPGAPQVAFIADPAQAFVAVGRAMARPGDPDPDVRIEKSTPLRIPSFLRADTHASMVVGTLTAREGRRRFAGVITTLPPTHPNGPWQLGLNDVASAPVDRFAVDLPTMTAVANSVSMHNDVIAQQTSRLGEYIQRRQNAVFQQSMASARQAQDSIDRSTAGFVHYLNDQSVVNHAPTATHVTMGNSLAHTLVNAWPNEYSIVPLNRYRKGIDY